MTSKKHRKSGYELSAVGSTESQEALRADSTLRSAHGHQHEGDKLTQIANSRTELKRFFFFSHRDGSAGQASDVSLSDKGALRAWAWRVRLVLCVAAMLELMLSDAIEEYRPQRSFVLAIVS